MSWVPGIGTGLTQLNDLYQTVQKADKEEHEYLFRIRKDLDALKGHLEDDPSIVLTKASTALRTLRAILSSSREEQQRIFDNPPNLNGILTALRTLAGSLQAYAYPSLTHPQPAISELQRTIPAADAALNGEIERQQGIVAKVISTIFKRGTREFEYTVQSLGGNGGAASALIFRHPLLELRHLIATFTQNSRHYLPQDREEYLRHTLNHLTFYSRFFDHTDAHPGIESFVLGQLGAVKLCENLPGLENAITTYLMQEIGWLTLPQHEDFYILLYDIASRNRDIRTPAREEKEGQLAWTREFLARDSSQQNRDIIWEAFSQYDDLKLMETLYQKIGERRECESVKELADNLDRLLRFFQHMPSGRVKDETLRSLATILVSWMSFARHWVEANASSGKAASLEQLQKAHHALNQGKHLEAIRLLRQEIENGPMGMVLAVDRDSVSPLKSFQEVTKGFEEAAQAKKQTSTTNWEDQLDLARINLSETLSFYVTFHVAFDRICGVPPRQSQQIYNQVITQVEQHPDMKTRKFFSLLSDELDKLSEVSLFFRMTAKLAIFPLYMIARLLGNHITTSTLHYVKHYIQLPLKEPLGKIHVTPIEKLTRCFQANIGSMKAWAEDRTCTKWGATTRKEAFAKILRDPKLNDRFEREELVMKSGLLATDLFVTICQLQEGPKRIRLNIAVNVARPSFGFPANHWANFIASAIKSILALAPQIAAEVFYYLFKLIDYISNSLFQWGLKKVLVTYDLPNQLFKSIGHSLYHSQYVPVFDEMILKQLHQIERVIDEERPGGQFAENESDTTREIFKEMIENLFEMIEMRHNLTKEKMRNPRKDDLPLINEHTRDVVRGLVDDNLSEALVNILITLIQSLFNEDQMNDFLLNFIRAITASFKAEESILDDEEKQRLNRLKGTPQGERVIQGEIKKKLYQQEREIHDALQRIIRKSVRQVVQVTVDQVTSQRASLEYIEWIERCFYGGERGNFLIGMRRKLEAFKKPHANKSETISELEREFLTFMRELEEKQMALDLEPVSHTRRLQHFANTVLLSHLQRLSSRLRTFIDDKSLASCRACEETLSEFNRTLLIKKTKFRSIKAVELERKHLEGEGVIGKTRVAVRGVFDIAIPAVATKVEEALCRKLNTLARGVLRLPKDSTFSESLICHTLLLPFMQTNGLTPDLRFSEESQIIREYG